MKMISPGKATAPSTSPPDRNAPVTRRRSRRARPQLDALEPRALLAAWSATGAGPGGPPEVRIFDDAGIERHRFLAFDAAVRGGVEVALGDVDGDGVPDLVAGSGPGAGGGRVRVFDGRDGRPLAGPLGDFLPFAAGRGRGVSVATGDVDGDGRADVIVGAGAGVAPVVKVFSGRDGSELSRVLAFHESFRGGVRVAAGQFRPGGGAEVAVAAGPGAIPLVKVLDVSARSVLARYAAFAPAFRGGVSVAAGDVDGDDVDDVVVGQGAGGRSRVRAFAGATSRVLLDRTLAGPGAAGGVRVGVGDANGDGRADLYLAPRAGGATPVHVRDAASWAPIQGFRVATPTAGVSVAGLARTAVGTQHCTYEFETNPLGEYPLLDRLAIFDPGASGGDGLFVPVAAGSVGNSATTAKNVYVIAHGWMPGFLDWVNSVQVAPTYPLPTSWDTWQTDSGVKPSTPWLFEEVETTSPVFDVTTTGLAQQILAADPDATVLAYSWIDESATCTNWAGIPEDVFHSRAYTTMNGLRLAQALTQALAPGYDDGLGRVHLIGHSHGARVATVAALALQQAARQDADLDVLGQLTLLDSPEDDDAILADDNPVDIDAANFAWFELAQMDIARTVAGVGGTTAGSATVSGVDATYLVPGMGVAGAGIPAGTTVVAVAAGAGQVTLSQPATATGRPTITFTPPPGSLFVDSYVSFYGAPYNNFVVDAPDHGIRDRALTNIIDVNLEPLPYTWFDTNVISYKHEYAAAWYAGSATTGGQPAGERVGLAWSPLVAGAPTGLAASTTQTWTDDDLGPDTQFLLGTRAQPATVAPVFTPVALAQTATSGDVTPTSSAAGVTGVRLSDDEGTATWTGTLDKADDAIVGFSFDYDFTQVGDGAQLQIWLDDALYFAMTGSVARSSLLPGSGALSTTFGLGYESTGAQTIRIRLVDSAPRTAGAAASTSTTTVTVDNFHVFTMG
jgi:hypothetical protein